MIGLCLAACSAGDGRPREAAHMDAKPVDQLVVAGNACGPAALLNSFRFGNDSWRGVYDSVKGDGEREKIRTVIRDIGMRPSRHLPGRARWSRGGVSVADLQDIANEMAAEAYQPFVSEEVFFRGDGESPRALLRRVHRRLEGSLARGLPPLLSVRRYAASGGSWRPVDAHFVTVVSVPRSLGRDDGSFAVSYIDPWGGRRCEGTIRIAEQALIADKAGVSSCLEAVFPQSSVGRKKVRGNERSALAVAAALGRW
ncbi:MAG: hypothetical protein H7A49_17690 [Akkermansiaceae bacterium]|nr:hypothetical protein [Akkermansiaceae bacterium]MCP5549187.1 hypothetical protein [Akkermansiaceae bacterium]